MSEVLYEKAGALLKKNLLFVLLIVFLLGGVGDHFLVKKDKRCVCDISDMNSRDEVKVSGKLRVDVSGAVKNPGVYELDDGAVVGDTLSMAGGATNEASASWVSRYLNLSDKVNDSEKIYVPFEWEFYFPEKYSIVKTVNTSYVKNDLVGIDNVVKDEDASGGRSASSGNNENIRESTSDTNTFTTGSNGKINVNTASSSELDSLPGIGPAYAEKIISNRPYKDLSEFEEMSGLYKSNIDKIKDLITF